MDSTRDSDSTKPRSLTNILHSLHGQLLMVQDLILALKTDNVGACFILSGISFHSLGSKLDIVSIQRKDRKAYILLFTCSLSRAVFLELNSSLTTQEFIKSSKKLVTRRRKSRTIYSDKDKTFEITTGRTGLT